MKITDKKIINDRYMVAYQHPDTGEIYLYREDCLEEPEHLEECVIDLNEIDVVYDNTVMPEDYSDFRLKNYR